jgi:hypothetical protein
MLEREGGGGSEREREKKRKREKIDREREIGYVRSKLGTVTGNFFSGKRDGERDRLG